MLCGLLQALQDYTSITRRFGDLAITNYARLGRAFMLYQTGNASEAILELQAGILLLQATLAVSVVLACQFNVLYFGAEMRRGLGRRDASWCLRETVQMGRGSIHSSTRDPTWHCHSAWSLGGVCPL